MGLATDAAPKTGTEAKPDLTPEENTGTAETLPTATEEDKDEALQHASANEQVEALADDVVSEPPLAADAAPGAEASKTPLENNPTSEAAPIEEASTQTSTTANEQLVDATNDGKVDPWVFAKNALSSFGSFLAAPFTNGWEGIGKLAVGVAVVGAGLIFAPVATPIILTGLALFGVAKGLSDVYSNYKESERTGNWDHFESHGAEGLGTAAFSALPFIGRFRIVQAAGRMTGISGGASKAVAALKAEGKAVQALEAEGQLVAGPASRIGGRLAEGLENLAGDINAVNNYTRPIAGVKAVVKEGIVRAKDATVEGSRAAYKAATRKRGTPTPAAPGAAPENAPVVPPTETGVAAEGTVATEANPVRTAEEVVDLLDPNFGYRL